MSTWNVHVAEVDGDVVLYVGGELDMATWPAMEEALTAVCSCPGEVVVVDVSCLTFMDCGGLGLLVVADERLKAEGRRVVLAAHASVAMRAIREREGLELLGEQLNEALSSRDVIGQAKGILMERLHVTPEDAFDILRTSSQQLNLKLREIAERLTETGELVDGTAPD